MSKIVFVKTNGEVIDLDPIPDLTNTVAEIQARVADFLGIHPERVSLLSSDHELEGSMQLCEALQCSATTSIDVTVGVVIHKCRTRPEHYASCLTTYKVDPDEPLDRRSGRDDFKLFQMVKAYVKCGRVEFPEPTGININMMPFVIGEKESLPDEFHTYWSMIEQCRGLVLENGSIGYLTIQESMVEQNESQRRPGLHIESPGMLMRKHGHTHEWGMTNWGGGHSGFGDYLYGGIYMASTLAGSCRVFNAQVKHPEVVVGPGGDIEHLHEFLQDVYKYDVDAGELIWITDTTPHESLPVVSSAFRQFFRVVSSSVSVWYAAHSTKNRLGITPPERVLIIEEDKFIAQSWNTSVAIGQSLDDERLKQAKHVREELCSYLTETEEFLSNFEPNASGLYTMLINVQSKRRELVKLIEGRHELSNFRTTGRHSVFVEGEELTCLSSREKVHAKRMELETAIQKLVAAKALAGKEEEEDLPFDLFD